MELIKADILILGAGGAGLMAALRAYDANKNLNILIAAKGVLGKGGCSRMVQGGFNVVLNPEDSHKKHFTDTLKGGQFINNQDLAWTLVTNATTVIKLMETSYGCFFDRNPDGTIHQKPFAGQSFDRTVHKGDLTGIEIISRAVDQIFKHNIRIMDEHRALDLLFDRRGSRVVGALLVDMRQGKFIVVNARVTLVATGGGPTMYKYFAPALDKSADGLALLYRSGAEMVDMEMVQFHPTGLLVKGSVVAGTVLEEGLRGAGARLYNALGERYMERYAPDAKERATRDVVSRCGYLEIMAGRAFNHGGLNLDGSHLGAEFIYKNFPGMAQRCADYGFDLGRGPVPVTPTAHYFMGGAIIDTQCRTTIDGLFAAGEDSGGVHGANRLGGNGIADSCVFGTLAGEAMAHYAPERDFLEPDPQLLEEARKRARRPFESKDGESPFSLRNELRELMWAKVGLVRNGKELKEAMDKLDEMAQRLLHMSVSGPLPYNMKWHEWINLTNMIQVSQIVARSAILRQESRGSHYRSDFPNQDNKNYLINYVVKQVNGEPQFETRPVQLTRMVPPDLEVSAAALTTKH
jgi:fumarate reductase flavoprotein subunit